MIGALGQKRALNGDQLKNPGANHLKFVVQIALYSVPLYTN